MRLFSFKSERPIICYFLKNRQALARTDLGNGERVICDWIECPVFVVLRPISIRLRAYRGGSVGPKAYYDTL